MDTCSCVGMHAGNEYDTADSLLSIDLESELYGHLHNCLCV